MSKRTETADAPQAVLIGISETPLYETETGKHPRGVLSRFFAAD